MTTKILALDLGQHCGWAYSGHDRRILFGTEKFERKKSEDVGIVWLRFATWVSDIASASDCELIAYEDIMAHRGTIASHWYGGFWAHTTAMAAKANIRCIGVGVKTIKMSACGRGDAGKNDIVMAMIRKGHNPMNDNEADALALLHHVLKNHGT